MAFSFEPILQQAAVRIPALRKVAETPYKIKTKQTRNPFSPQNPNTNRFGRKLLEGTVNTVKNVALGNPSETERALDINRKQFRGQDISPEDNSWQNKRVSSQAPMVAGMVSPVKSRKADAEWRNWLKGVRQEVNNTPIEEIEKQVLNKTRDNGTMTRAQAKEWNRESQRLILESLGIKLK